MKRLPARSTNVVEADSAVLAVENVSSGYGDSVAVQQVSLTVGPGECVGILGPNGAGKTTLLRTISGIVGLSAGRLTFCGQDVSHVSPHRVARLGIAHVPEGRCVYPGLTVEENLRLGLFARGDRRLGRARIEETLLLFPWMAGRLNQLGFSLSGGEQQMLAIARGLVSDPQLLLLDEPSLGLSPVAVDGIFETLHQVRRRGISILIVEQSVDRLLDLADRAYVMNNGQVVLEGSAEEFRSGSSIYSAYIA